MPDVREAVLVLLYRLLFILYAEDRDLLPVRDKRYDDYALRNVRGDIGQRKDQEDVFSARATRYWSALDDLCQAIAHGDASIGLPAYNGGLFDQASTPLLGQIRLDDAVMATVIDALSFEQTPDGRRYINYRDLGVQQLGSIYERLIEHDLVRERDEITIRLNRLARKGSGSYYTSDDLVALIIKETIEPLVRSCIDAFLARHAELATSPLSEDRRIGRLKPLDPAEKLLDLKVCDPAMGSGHFLVNLVDYLADRVITTMAEAEAAVDGYLSPLIGRIDNIRTTIMAKAEASGWTIDEDQLDDRHIVRRMVLKRCVYGIDKNPMAVELAKVALWLHTFTVGAPLSFLDHHLRCGDSLFGSWVRTGIETATEQGGSLFLAEPITRATRAAAPMQILEGLTDAEIAEAQRSAEVFAEIEAMTTPLNTFLSLVQAFEWLNIRDRDDQEALFNYFSGTFGDPIEIASGKIEVVKETRDGERFAELLGQARRLTTEEQFLNWQVAFPGVWSAWERAGLHGGFDAVIGNPPWDRMKLQQVEWFAARRREIAMATPAAIRKRMIADLETAGDPLAREFADASGLAPTDPDVRILPHPAPRQTASLRAVAYPLGPGSQAMATAIPTACLASAAIRCRDVETGPNLGGLAVFSSTGATCRCPLPSTGSRGLNAPASAVSGRRRRPSKGSPPSAAQTVRAVFPHTAFTRLPGGREMEGVNEWTFCSPVGLSQSASLLGRSLLGLSHKELIRAIGLTHSRPAVSPTTLPTDFPSPPGCRSRGRTAFTARQVLFGRPTPRTTSPSTSPSDL